MDRIQISFNTFSLQWTLWTTPDKGAVNSCIISEMAATRLIKDLKLNRQEVVEYNPDEEGDANRRVLGYEISFKAN